MTATWNGATIAESDDIVVVEGNSYFPSDAVDRRFVQPSARRTTCPWKCEAHYYDLVVDGATNAGATWYYPHPTPAAPEEPDG